MLFLMCQDDAARVIIWGEEVQSGAYLLRVRIERPLRVSFGRYRGGRPLAVPAGYLLYAGSAMGRMGSSTLARRLLRHATRSGDRPAHAIRASLLRCLRREGLGPADLQPPRTKRLHWHADYLLDEAGATLDAVVALRSARRSEEQLAGLLARSPHTAELAAGLGASDAPGHSHLLRFGGGLRAWQGLLHRLREAALHDEDGAHAHGEHQ